MRDDVTGSARIRLFTLVTIGVAATVTVLAVLFLSEPEVARTFGLSDCEAMGAGAVAQPAAAWSALAIVIAGAWITATADQKALSGVVPLGAAASAAGLASFVAHARAFEIAGRFDAAGVPLVAIALAAVAAGKAHAPAVGTGAVALVGLVVWAPGTLDAVGIAAVLAAAIIAWATRDRRRHATAVFALASFAAGAMLWAMGRSGGPWCDPHTLLQPHAGWHVAVGLGLVIAARYLAEDVHPQHGPAPTLGPSQ